jgi:hypothetical protein
LIEARRDGNLFKFCINNSCKKRKYRPYNPERTGVPKHLEARVAKKLTAVDLHIEDLLLWLRGEGL